MYCFSTTKNANKSTQKDSPLHHIDLKNQCRLSNCIITKHLSYNTLNSSWEYIHCIRLNIIECLLVVKTIIKISQIMYKWCAIYGTIFIVNINVFTFLSLNTNNRLHSSILQFMSAHALNENSRNRIFLRCLYINLHYVIVTMHKLSRGSMLLV